MKRLTLSLVLLGFMVLAGCEQAEGDFSRAELEQITQEIAINARQAAASLDAQARQRLRLANSGFEQGLESWNQCTLRFRVPSIASSFIHVYSGSQAAQTGAKLEYRCAYQNVTLPAELNLNAIERIIFSCYVKFPTDFDFAYGYANYLSIDLSGADFNGLAHAKLEFSQGITGSYQRQRVIIENIPQGVDLAQVTIFGRDNFWVDQCSLIAVTSDGEIDLSQIP